MTTGLASAGLVFVALPRVADSPQAKVVSPTDHVPGPRFDVHRAWVDARPEAAPPPQHRSTPPLPLMVRFEGGLLAIRAHAAPLGDVLAAVTNSVGVRFVGADDAREPVSIDAGPAPVSQVLSALLAVANYGYAFLGGADHAGGVRPARVILLKQVGTLEHAAAAMPAKRRPPVPAPQDQVMPASADEPGVRQQQVLDQLLDACKQQGCDTS